MDGEFAAVDGSQQRVIVGVEGMECADRFAVPAD
jgi:hypothetical protein